MQTQVLIIGGGVTGAGLARDLALRGIPCLLCEKTDINSGASGGNHGLLHSGARYVASDQAAARECLHEREILKQIAPHCVNETGGLFVAVPGDDENYVADFPRMCAQSGINAKALDPARALELEPALSPDLIAAYQVRDGAIDPFMLALDNVAQAQALGARVRRNWQVVGMSLQKERVTAVRFWDHNKSRQVEVKADLVINATGAWAGMVAALAGVRLNILYSKGTLLVSQNLITQRVINRLRPPSDSDILVPAGTVSVLGTTSQRVESPDQAPPSIPEVDQIIDDARAMLPVLDQTRFIRAYSGVRPLVADGCSGDDREVSRDFSLLDHAEDGLENFITITGGKLTTYRLMAERAADLACQKLGNCQPCRTRTEPLPPSDMGRWTEPGLAPLDWLEHKSKDDLILCECEMMGQNSLDELLQDLDGMSGRSILKALSLRTRVGKGPCQGGFCGLRITAHLHDTMRLEGSQGAQQLKSFVERRWRGYRPVQWGEAMQQAELQEAIYCGMLDLELGGEPAS